MDPRAMSWCLALAVGALVVSRPATVAACKPPIFLPEDLKFELVAAHRGGQPAALAGLPAQLHMRSAYDVWIEGLGMLKLAEATTPLPRKTERYLRHQRRLARVICAILVYRAPVVPGRYVPHHDPYEVEPVERKLAALWPIDVPGVAEFAPDRDALRLRIEGPEELLELEYRLTRATFHRCDVAGQGSPAGALALLLLTLGLRRRRPVL